MERLDDFDALDRTAVPSFEVESFDPFDRSAVSLDDLASRGAFNDLFRAVVA